MKRRSNWYDVILLTIAVCVFVAMIAGLGWAGDSPANTQTALDVLGRNYLEGPAAAVFWVVFFVICFKLYKAGRRGKRR
jgi:hypothetical protein